MAFAGRNRHGVRMIAERSANCMASGNGVGSPKVRGCVTSRRNPLSLEGFNMRSTGADCEI
ncbi:MAG: hypothetical protein OJF50_006092 [Nitrospira sp.]|nr:hypothetical protein [Nitrospira sp.]